MKTLTWLGIFAFFICNYLASVVAVEAANDVEAIQERMSAIERALQQMAEISAQSAQTVKRLSENVEKLANDYANFKKDSSQRLTLLEQGVNELKLQQQRSLLSASPQEQNKKATERKYPPYPWEAYSPNQQKVTERTRPVEDIIYVREVYPSSVDAELPLSNEQMNHRPYAVYWILGLLGFASYFIVHTSSF
jgi:hypothetical protein